MSAILRPPRLQTCLKCRNTFLSRSDKLCRDCNRENRHPDIKYHERLVKAPDCLERDLPP